MKEKKKLSLAAQIFIALVLAIIAGLLMQNYADFANSYIKPFGTIFLNLVKFIVVPIVLFSIMCGIISMSDIRKVGSIGLKTVVYYLCTTAFAIAFGLCVGNLFKGMFPVVATTDLVYEASEPVSFMDTIVNIFPSNFFEPMVNANMLQVIVMAIVLGFAIILVGEEKNSRVIQGFQDLNDIFMKCMELILRLSPIGVFCLLCPVIAANGPAIIGSLAMVLLAAYICYIIHMAVVYSLTVKAIGGMSPLEFFKNMFPAMIFAFSSSSSVGTLPINMECVEKMGVSKEVSSFVLPLGATINMDGTAIYQGVCSLYTDENRAALPNIPVKGGVEGQVGLQYADEFSYVSTDGSNLSQVERVPELPEEVTAPVEKGDRIGRMVYVLNGREIGSTELMAADTVERAVYGDYIGQVFRIFLL